MLYREHGHELPEDLWATLVGTTHAPWSPMEHLEELVGEPLDRVALNEHRYAYELALIEAEEMRPGIVDYLAAARASRAEARDRLELVAPLDRPPPRAARGDARLGRDLHRRRRPGAREAVADALPRGARPPRRRARTKRSSSRTRRTASAPRRPPASSPSPSRTRSRATSVSTPREPTFSSTRSPTSPPEELLSRFAAT